MATIAQPLFSHLEYSTATAVSRVEGSRRASSVLSRLVSMALCASILWPLKSIADGLEKAIRFLNSDEAESLNDQQLRQIAHEINQLCDRLGKLLNRAERVGLTSTPVYSSLLRAIAERRAHLRSIGEGLYISLEPEFREVVREAVAELATERVDGPQRGSLVGQV